MSLSSGAAVTGFCSAVSVNSKFKSLGVNVIADGFHAIRKGRRIGHEIALRVSRRAPAIIDVDVLVSKARQLELHKLVCNLFDMIGGDSGAAKIIPSVVTHRRGQTDAIVDGGNMAGKERSKQKYSGDTHIGQIAAYADENVDFMLFDVVAVAEYTRSTESKKRTAIVPVSRARSNNATQTRDRGRGTAAKTLQIRNHTSNGLLFDW
jgi:hypothetical protein